MPGPPQLEEVGPIGDAKPPNGKPLPKAGTFAHAEAETVVARIAAEIGGSAPRAELGAFVNIREKEVLFTLVRMKPGEWALDIGRGTGDYTLSGNAAQ